jgi:spore coat protein U-like protein
MKNKCLLSLTIFMFAALACTNLVYADSTQVKSDLGVTAAVAAGCSIAVNSAVAFGAYDPTAASDLPGTGSLTLSCIEGTSYKMYISGTRKMAGVTTATEKLNFDLYSDAGHSAEIPTDNSGSSTTSLGISSTPMTIYGLVTKAQDVAIQSYSATLSATVEY